MIFKKEDYDQLPEKQTDEELDMLDLAYDLTDTSRLGCQIHITERLDGIEIQVPATINDARQNWIRELGSEIEKKRINETKIELWRGLC